MSIDEAAKATRKYRTGGSGNPFWIVVNETGGVMSSYFDILKTQAVCDRLNLIAVLEALREPSEGMARSAIDADDKRTGCETCKHIWRVMIDAAIDGAKGE